MQIDPCIPRAWGGFKVTRRFRDAVYEIDVRNPDHVCKGVKSIRVDGADVQGNRVPAFNDGQTHRIVVVLGNPDRVVVLYESGSP